MRRSSVATLAGVALSIGATPAAYASGTLTTPVTGLSSPIAIASADFDGDGYADLAIAQDGAVVLERNERDGSFSRAQVPAGENPVAIATADLNRDGKPDVATVSGADQAIDLELQNGAGGWTRVVLPSVGTDPSGIAIGDLDGDGWSDLAVSDASSDDILLLVRDPLTDAYDRTTLTNVDDDGGALGIAIGDVTGDGRADVVTANGENADSVSLFTRREDGGYTRRPLRLTGERRARAVAIGNLGGSGRGLDVAVALQRSSLSDVVSVFRRDGQGALAGRNLSSYTDGVRDYDGVATFDLMGSPALAASGGGRSVTVWSGPRLKPETFRTREDASGTAIGDFDGDGRVDVATLQRGAGTVAVVSHLVPLPSDVGGPICGAKASVTARTSCALPNSLSLSIEKSSLSFGAFTPGITKDYRVSTQAAVLSTIPGSALSVSGPVRLTSGANALGSPLTVELSRSSWPYPVSADPVTIAFKQHIDAAEVLRAGTYSSTVTFTLSATTP